MIDLAPVVIYTDGGCRGNPGPGGWAYLIIHTPSNTAFEGRGGENPTTNNRMEMTAAINALQALKTTKRLDIEIRSDSKNLVETARSWIYGWQKSGWKRKSGKIKNLDLVKILWELIHTHNIAWTWVRGHAGEPGNEYVDQMTNDAMDLMKAGQNPDYSQKLPKSPL